MDPAVTDMLLLALAWLAYFTVHSLLADPGLKCRVALHWPALMPGYRLGFNVIAVLLLALPLWLLRQGHGIVFWAWHGPWLWLSNLIVLAALAAFVVSLRYYDGREFIGLRQLYRRQVAVEDQEQFRLSPLHRYVRHPWYFLALVLIWTRDMDSLWLLSALLMSLYFILGSRLEEHKLMIVHGDVYRDYRRRVPAIIPLPWRRLSRAQAAELIRRSNER